MKLYYQTMDGKVPMWNFCGTAAVGARINGYDAKPFVGFNGEGKCIGVKQIDGDPANIIVGSVEAASIWLKDHGYDVPTPIDQKIVTSDDAKLFYKRNIEVVEHQDLHTIKYPKFIKPYGTIKAFTGFVMMSGKLKDLEKNTYGYKGLYQVHDVINFVSEYRMYIHKGKILGLCRDYGDFLTFPDKNRILEILEASPIEVSSYTIDVGVTDEGETLVIEFNDGWSLGNYGLDEDDYFNFVKDRWLEITNFKKYQII